MNTQNTDGCIRKTLSDSPGCRVEVCGCGTLHLTMGPLTLRMERGALEDLQNTLATALGALETREQRPAAVFN
ncbi:hypothetical protein P2318_22690 [Myxococcaceae bacterium GXIMD 01537]